MDFWTDFVFSPVGGFVLILLGAMFLLAEVLVKGRLIFGIFGLTSISLYFVAHIQEGMALWMIGTFVLGVLLIILDGKFIGDGTIGGFGLLVTIISLALPAPDFFYGLSVVAGFISGALISLVFPRYFPRRDMWAKLTLKHSLTSEKGYNSLSEEYKKLLGKEGIAVTDFRPTGTINVDGKVYSATSEGIWIKKGSKLIVNEVTGTRILVSSLEEDE